MMLLQKQLLATMKAITADNTAYQYMQGTAVLTSSNQVSMVQGVHMVHVTRLGSA